MRTRTTKPTLDGFHMPAEFDEHFATLLMWPERRDIWRNGARPVQRIIVQLAETISQFEKVIVGVLPTQFMNAKSLLPDNLSVMEVTYDDIWCRDTGPSFITNGTELRGVDWVFNSWGGIDEGSYYPWELDDLLPQKILEWFSADRYKCDMVLEGGAIHVDGEGTLIAIKSCILNKNRNPNKNISDVEEILKDHLGVSKIIWLENGLYLEENNGHIDNICSFIRPGEVLLAWTEDPNDPQYAVSHSAYKILSETPDAQGRNLRIHKLLMPPPQFMTQDESDGVEFSQYAIPRLGGDRLPASYMNFYFINGGAIVPKFGCREDDLAMDVFRSVMPERKIIPIPAREFLLGGGGIHCVTAQIPAIK